MPWIVEHEVELKRLLREMVECESPSDDPAAVARFVDLLASCTSGWAQLKAFPGKTHGPCALIDFDLPGPRRKLPGRILGVGHSDTVWPMGTLRSMPWRESEGRLWGPGVLDMKAGLVFFLYALRAIRELDLPVARPVSLWVVSDEEVGSNVSRPRTEKLARESVCALILEPGTGLEGKLKTARKGVGGYRVSVRGVASHSGVDFAAGASAVLELTRQLQTIAGFTDLSRGITVNPGLIRGGTRINVVPAEASAEIDMRIVRAKDAAAVDRKFRRLKSFDRRCSLEVEGGLNRPPMERNAGVVRLFKTAQRLAKRHLGRELEESLSGGGSDGNFTAAIGTPTLDGIGGVGEGAHAITESILTNRIADRTALLALLVLDLSAASAPHLGQ